MKKNTGPQARALAAFMLGLCAVTAAPGAWAQWGWRDANGNVTYSDSPPPADVRPTDILRQPNVAPAPSNNSSSYGQGSGDSAAPAAPANGNAPPPTSNAAPPSAANKKKTLAEQDAEFGKRRSEQQKADQKQAEADTQAAERGNRCAEAQGYLKMLEGGTRMFRPDSEGNRNYLNDEERDAQMKKLQDDVAANCSGQ